MSQLRIVEVCYLLDHTGLVELACARLHAPSNDVMGSLIDIHKNEEDEGIVLKILAFLEVESLEGDSEGMFLFQNERLAYWIPRITLLT